MSARTAIDHALEGMEATGIVDAQIRVTDGFERCVEVSGVAVRVLENHYLGPQKT